MKYFKFGLQSGLAVLLASLAACGSPPVMTDALVGIKVNRSVARNNSVVHTLSDQPLAVIISENTRSIIKSAQAFRSRGDVPLISDEAMTVAKTNADPMQIVTPATLILKKYFKNTKYFGDVSAAFDSGIPTVVVINVEYHVVSAMTGHGKWQAEFIFVKNNSTHDVIASLSGESDGSPDSTISLNPNQTLVSYESSDAGIRKHAFANLDQTISELMK